MEEVRAAATQIKQLQEAKEAGVTQGVVMKEVERMSVEVTMAAVVTEDTPGVRGVRVSYLICPRAV